MSFEDNRRRRGLRLGAALAGVLLVVACYEGPGPKEPPPGSPGGFCHAGGVCDEPTSDCDPEGQYCYDRTNPCRGVFCGEAGICQIDGQKPKCVCQPGFSNEAYSLYCEPL